MSKNKSLRTHREFTPKLGKGVYIDHSAVVIGDVELDDDSSVWPCAVIRGDLHSIRVGKRSSVQDNAVLHVTHTGPYAPDGWPVIVGNDVTIGHSACLHGCTIGDRVLVGIGATVLDGAIVENDVVIGAGTLVPPGKRLESGYMYMGSPATQVRPLKESEREFFSYSAENYKKLKNEYLEAENSCGGSHGGCCGGKQGTGH